MTSFDKTQTSKLVISLLGGDLNQGFPVVTAELWDRNQFLKITGSLPPAPQLSELYVKWQLLYEAVHQRMGSNQRIKMYRQDINNISANDFEDVCKQLQPNINAWLKSKSFQHIEEQLRTRLHWDDEIRVIIETDAILLHRLPWHLWNFFEHYPKAELALSNHVYASPPILPISTGKVKILAILGDSSNIDVEKDRSLLQKLEAKTTFLVQPTRKELDEQLWNRDWDIIFFAGHSGSDKDIGKIYINPSESLTIFQLKNSLSSAIGRGLKLAIFNSCDGISLARNLAELNIPQMIVMRERVPDLVAQEFLKNFLVAFAGGKSFYLSVREARSKLQGLENNFPCASWLPVIYQNPATVPITWQGLCNVNAVKTYGNDSKKTKLWTVLLTSIIVTTSVISSRYLGIFQKAELQSFDQMLVMRPKEKVDPRLLVVEVTEKDIQSLQQTTQAFKSVSDGTLAKLINKLQKYQPRIIGLDIYRDFADPDERANPIKLDNELSKENLIAVCKGKDRKYDLEGVKPPKAVPLERQGFTDSIWDSDGVVRRQILLNQPERDSPCITKYSLAVQLAVRYLFEQDIKLNISNEDYIQFDSKEFKKVFQTLKFGHSGAYQQGTDLNGVQLLINYRNTNEENDYRNFGYESVTLDEVLNDKLTVDSLERLIKDKVVIIGVTANTISKDTVPTPYSTTQGSYEKTPGVFIQAQMVSQILSAVLDNRPILWVLPAWGDILWIWGWSLVSGLIVWRSRCQVDKGGSIVATVIILYGVCTLCIFQQGLWLPFVPSAFGVVTSGVAVLFIQRHSDE